MQIVGGVVMAVGALIALTGLWKMITRRGTSYRWRYEPPDWAVREDIPQGGFRAFVGGLFRVAIGAAIAYGGAMLLGQGG